MALLSDGTVIIHDGNAHQFITPREPNDQGTHGLIPRPYAAVPRGSYPWASAIDFPLIDQSEWAARIAEKDAAHNWLTDLRMKSGPGGGMIPSRDQNGKGYCWAHSGTSAHLLFRAKMGAPYADLSAYAIACQIKNFADEGGWGAQGVDWQMQNGVPTSATWPQQSMSRSNVNEAMKADAAKHKITGEWADLQAQQYDRSMSWAQLVTLLLSDCPVVTDFNWWSHSVCGAALTNGANHYGKTRDADSGKLISLPDFDDVWGMSDLVTGGIGLIIWNSWGDSWSNQGTGVLTGNKAVPDGAVGLRSVAA